jgi:hypothetical protein
MVISHGFSLWGRKAQARGKELFFRKWGEISGLGIYPSLCELVEGIVTAPYRSGLSEFRTFAIVIVSEPF